MPRNWSIRGLAAAGLIAYATVTLFPGRFMATTPGPDPSWVYALNILPQSGYSFSADLVFTFGPLGRLMYPTVPPSSVLASAFTWVGFAIIMVSGLIYQYLRGRSLARLAAAVVTLILGLAFGIPYEYQLLIVLALLLGVPPEDRRVWTIASIIAACLGAGLFYVKTTSGIAAIAMLATAGAWWAFKKEASPTAVALRVAVPFAAVFLLLGLVLIGPPAQLAGWLRTTLEVAAGYGNAMTIDSAGAVKLLALLALAIFAVWAVSGRKRDSRDLFLPILFAGPLYLAFRHSFVRHHGRYLIPFLLSITALGFLLGSSRRRIVETYMAVALMLPLAIGATLADECLCPFEPVLLGRRGIENISRTVNLTEVRRVLTADSEEALELEHLPSDWVEKIRLAGEVAILPWEITFAAANHLDWRPAPVIQTYHAYTDSLDRLVAEDLARRGPPHLLLQFVEFDGRYPLWSTPETWISIITHYDLVDTLGPGEGREPVALMSRRATPLDIGLVDAGTTSARFDEWIEIPEEPGLAFSSFHFQHDAEGTLASLLWHTDPVLMEFRFQDGHEWAARFLPGTGEGRHLAEYPPLLFDQLVALLRGDLPQRAVAFRIFGPGAESFRPDFRVTWWTSTWMDEPLIGDNGDLP
ncbi:MAG: hypothetical protein ACRDH9_08585 [Actinomycetota bacterium]